MTPAGSSIRKLRAAKRSAASFGAWAKPCSSSRRPTRRLAASSTATIPAIWCRPTPTSPNSRSSCRRIDKEASPLGAKGLGELTAVSVAPAIANAVYHATGKRIRDLPITIESCCEAGRAREPKEIADVGTGALRNPDPRQRTGAEAGEVMAAVQTAMLAGLPYQRLRDASSRI